MKLIQKKFLKWDMNKYIKMIKIKETLLKIVEVEYIYSKIQILLKILQE